jgi:dienelactone hydrolase
MGFFGNIFPVPNNSSLNSIFEPQGKIMQRIRNIWRIPAFGPPGFGLIQAAKWVPGKLACVGAILSAGCLGTTAHLVDDDSETVLSQHSLEAADPSQPGEYEVETLFYGSGTDKKRKEYRDEVTLKTATVDASAFVEHMDTSLTRKRKGFWGFDQKHFPLNGRVWSPSGEGPFPLVLIVHGNHQHWEFSDPGYAYLGELMASRGFIFVSVDENFLNGSMQKENDARGWMLLKHLEQWKAWNGEKGHRFFGKVDMDRVALIGHSRGGEAVGHAAAFNRLSHYPDNANVRFDFNFSIKGLIAFAPSDGQYKPADRPTPVENVNYLVLQGAHDSDVSIFLGLRQYNRVKFTNDGDYFKAAVYIYRANHSRFNTSWGKSDYPWPLSWLLNYNPILKEEEQRQIAKVYVSAFLETVLHEDRSYLPMFRDHRVIGDWLPETIYLTQYEDSRFRRLADFEEDIDVKTASIDGGRLEGESLAVWSERVLRFRDTEESSQQNHAVALGWRHGDGDESVSGPAFSISLPAGTAGKWGLDSAGTLMLSLAKLDEDLPDEGDSEEVDRDKGKKAEVTQENDENASPNEEDKEGEKEPETEKGDDEEDDEEEALDLTVELVSADGYCVGLPLSGFGPIRPPLKIRLSAIGWKVVEDDRVGKASEQVLQTYALPLSAFVEANEKFDPRRLRTIRLRFNRSDFGVVFLDRVGFRSGEDGRGEEKVEATEGDGEGDG